MPYTAECFLFAGPSLCMAEGVLPVPATIRLLPPARRGDIVALCRKHPPGVLVLADGQFHHCAAVGHAELREAIRKGWQVWGLASLGAIRAYEMRALGMCGFGQVYALFSHTADFQDDEVALLHEPEPPYRPLSEPLVHLRVALKCFQARGLLSAVAADSVATHLKSLWYGDRSLRLFEDLVRPYLPASQEAALQAEMAAFDRYRIKSLDLMTFLKDGLWKPSPTRQDKERDDQRDFDRRE